MGWADKYIKILFERGEVIFNPFGNSMKGKIESGDTCKIIIIPNIIYNIGDIVLCKVSGKQYLHLISAIDRSNVKFQISNNKNYINGWINYHSIYGICSQVNDKILISLEDLKNRNL